jgi:serine/threonine protein kinase/tetratricopeptide (TPR) repeat protein
MQPDDPPRDARDPGIAGPAEAKEPQPPAHVEEAFAATIAPSMMPTPPGPIAAGTATRGAPGDPEPSRIPASGKHVPIEPASAEGASSRKEIEREALEATMAAPVVGDLPPLPIVPDTHYKPDKEIARGGMGRIIAAEDQRLGRPVALKELLEPAGDALGRFQREALITARLQHPGIVPVYEAGRWPSGEPFFAMKLVSGRPFDKVIGEALTLEDRLALLPRMVAAADAIAYAHSQRVIHRDLKPGNVLIGDFGETVVIDWGLAKDLEVADSPESATRYAKPPRPGTEGPGFTPGRGNDQKPKSSTSTASATLTVAGAVMGTPAYMAPEQARGEPVDERADVFALGAMLYHLLAGVPPYNARTATDVIAAAALARVVPLREREEGAPRDLVAIVERAMASRPDDRYPHAGELADELRRFLTGQLVSAHRYTTRQRIVRFIKKHQAAVTIGGIAVVVFAVFGTLAIRQIVKERDNANRERVLAVGRGKAAEQLIDKMLSDVKERLTAIGRLDLLANLGSEIRDYYQTLSNVPGGMPPDDVDRMAIAIDLVGRAERESGKADQALKTWTDARAQLVAALATSPKDTTFPKRAMIARLDFQIGTIYQSRGKVPEARAIYGKAREEFAALRTEQPDHRLVLLHSAENHDRLGDLLRNDGHLDAAFDEYSLAKQQRTKATSAGTARAEDVLALSSSHLKVGSISQLRGDSAAGLSEYRRALRLRESLLEAQPDNVELQERVLDVQKELAALQSQTGDEKSAIETYQRALPMIDAMVRRDPSNTTWKRSRGNLLADLGFAQLDSGDFKAGLAQLESAIETQRELVAYDSKTATWQFDLSRSYTRAGDGYIYTGAIDDGIARYEQALELRNKLAARDPKSVPYKRSLAFSFAKLGAAYNEKGNATKAISSHDEALALRQKLVEGSPTQIMYRNELATTEIALGRLLVTRDARRAEALLASGLSRARALSTSDPINLEWKETLMQGLLATAELQRDPQARRAMLDEAIAIAFAAITRSPQNIHWPGYLAETHAALAQLATDAKTRSASWQAVRNALEPLAAASRLPATRKALLDRARASR